MTELERKFQETMRANRFHIRYNGEFTCQSYDKYFQIWLIGYNAANN